MSPGKGQILAGALAVVAVSLSPMPVRAQQVEQRFPQSQTSVKGYTKQQLIAPILGYGDDKSPLTLAYLFPISRGGLANQAEFLVTLHTGKDQPEHLVFWKNVGDDQYLIAKVIQPNDPEEHFETPMVFFPKGQVPGEGVLCVDVPIDGYRSHADQVFAIDRGELLSVDIGSPDKFYKSKLGPGEQVWYPATNSFSDDKLGFAFNVWNGDDPICCPTGGQVTGTYKFIENRAFSGGVAFSPITGGILQRIPLPMTVPTKWKIVVDTAQRVPAAANAR
jgi:hypothetical protein